MSTKLYLIGSLRNPEVPNLHKQLTAAGFEIFSDWFAAGERADDAWKEYESLLGHSYIEALEGHAACHVFEFDKRHLDESDGAILMLPAGKSGHLELGYMIGQGKPGFILLDNPDRWDVMYKFAGDGRVVSSVAALIKAIDEAL
jgi:nucleoside 2-deoxyribosyltransferase